MKGARENAQTTRLDGGARWFSACAGYLGHLSEKLVAF